MPDQQVNAGNIGDVVKHYFLVSLFELWRRSVRTRPVHYVETHAGFLDYPIRLLQTRTGSWKGERAWGIGLAGGGSSVRTLGRYGKTLRRELKTAYPGSLRWIQQTIGRRGGVQFTGFDISPDAVQSYTGQTALQVSRGDGYQGAASVASPKFVFCDPFWKDPKRDMIHIRVLLRKLDRQDALVVWYPCRSKSIAPVLANAGLITGVEVQFAQKPLFSRECAGAGLAFIGLPPQAKILLLRRKTRLQRVFAGQANRKGRQFDLK